MMKNVSLFTHTKINDTKYDPDGIVSYGTEIECERDYAGDDFIDISYIEPTGTNIELREINTEGYT